MSPTPIKCEIAAVLIAGLLVGQVPLTRASDFSDLLKNSPFGGVEPPVTTPAPVNLEFRGMFVEQGEFYFSVYDASSRRRQWVTLNETGHPFTALSFDPDDESLIVSYQGRTVRLKLTQAKILGGAPVLSANGPAATPPDASPGATDAPPPPILRRRALKPLRTPEPNRPEAPAPDERT